MRVVRLARIMRLGKYLARMTALNSLINGMVEAASPLTAVAGLLLMSIMGFAIMMTSLVPSAADDEETQEVLIRFFGGVGQSAITLLSGMSGASDWGPDVAFVLYTKIRDDGQWEIGSSMLLVSMVLVFAVLSLGLNGLVTAIFLEQLFSVADREDEKVAASELWEAQQVMGALTESLAECVHHPPDGIDPVPNDTLSWPIVKHVMSSQPRIQEGLAINLTEAKLLFKHLDEDDSGKVNYDDFIFAIFRLRAMYKSVDMHSVDYQQEKALQRVGQLETSLKRSVSGLYSRLSSLYGMLPDIEDEVKCAKDAITEVFFLQEALEDKKAYREKLESHHQKGIPLDPDAAGTKDLFSLRMKSELNRALAELEASTARHARKERSVTETKKLMESLAVSAVHSVKMILQREVSKVRQEIALKR